MKTPRRLLLWFPNWLGDVVFTTPVLESLRQAMPQTRLTGLAVPRAAELLEGNPWLDELQIYDPEGVHRSPIGLRTLAGSLRRGNFDAALLLKSSRTRALLCAAAGIPVRVGALKGGFPWPLTHASHLHYDSLHRTDYYLELSKPLGISAASACVKWFVAEGSAQLLEPWLREQAISEEEPYLVLHPGGNWEPKRWPAESFSLAARQLCESHGMRAVLIGTQPERGLAEEIAAQLPNAPVIASGSLNLKQLSALLQGARLMLSNDSGPLHMAVGLGVPAVGIYGPTNPAITGPRGNGPLQVVQSAEPGSIKEVPVDRVVEAAQSVLAGNPRVRSLHPHLPIQARRPVNRILVVTLSNLGDVILTLPVIHQLAELFPQADLEVAVGPRAGALLEGDDRLKRLWVYDKQEGLDKRVQLLLQLRSKEYDLLVDLRSTVLGWFLARSAHNPVLQRAPQWMQHRVERNLWTLERALDGVFGRGCWRAERSSAERARQNARLLPLRDSEREWAESALGDKPPERGWAVLGAGARSYTKMWDCDRLAQVARELIGSGYGVILLGGRAEAEASGRLLQRLRGEKGISSEVLKDLAGRTSIRQAAAVVARAGLVIANDSAISHLAWAYARPSVTVFGPTDPEKYAPAGSGHRIARVGLPCSPCEQALCRYHHECMEWLSPGDIWKKVLEITQ
ncbi:MAG: glycosyltransferase family 9 protein [Candidatus Omnitrophica bacterium]|nr:glycosyltransferase family 9 protein [Candidatus Omnitrophota bacterium]